MLPPVADMVICRTVLVAVVGKDKELGLGLQPELYTEGITGARLSP